jgi:hypothetical protein
MLGKIKNKRLIPVEGDRNEQWKGFCRHKNIILIRKYFEALFKESKINRIWSCLARCHLKADCYNTKVLSHLERKINPVNLLCPPNKA